MKIGNREFDTTNRTYLMGILNCTPDSFSDGGRYMDLDSALRQTEKMLAEGADIIDVGGESTRPGYIPVSEQEEIERIAPVIEKIRERFETVISVDTYKSRVAEAAIDAGAALVNDIWGCKGDERMAQVIAGRKVCCCLMHNRDVTLHPYKKTLMEEILTDLRESVAIAVSAGVRKEKVIIDPVIGFAKTYDENLQALAEMERLNELGYPVLLGTSRKSVIGLALSLDREQRLEGTIATSVIGVMKGCSFVRVHDVLENKRAVQMAEAILHHQ